MRKPNQAMQILSPRSDHPNGVGDKSNVNQERDSVHKNETPGYESGTEVAKQAMQRNQRQIKEL
jgi:hypothetical protein